ncbi:MAG TPA: exodeoxyribonuclease VII small subunit [Candidatus Methanoculleus thermohydrogenotrophicum]|jgi:exodeoxyribonuclease VII small subunit|nr:exodeoxyribonuclease VII small subunit [Candidatus Methanoculleus thermohydrogenotrophicum]NLM81545.1 exodeoxyribonuclease VII small subunit [Candidatus Methanoculleus thermohydrogenotrophicum]HOB18433.1 exodeoxyribonuclease VII small subunit [Candidatus Methanoculleus thermohydrogenotrophicum]HPZ38521.1 exodeoxyribonuclease VII small subunit [Candidatus Methanoculleus thermohydrogenotrophicum]HQC91644.1 exodeoxyribonuclease VII small subunit [Candidatus Methanoculleus thermohydrogenotrophic
MTKTFEEMLEELREIVRKLEDGGGSLEESIAMYERGALLVKQCEDLLNEAEMKLTELGRDR